MSYNEMLQVKPNSIYLMHPDMFCTLSSVYAFNTIYGKTYSDYVKLQIKKYLKEMVDTNDQLWKDLDEANNIEFAVFEILKKYSIPYTHEEEQNVNDETNDKDKTSIIKSLVHHEDWI